MKIILYSPMTHTFQINFMVISWRNFSFFLNDFFHGKLTYMKWTAAIQALTSQTSSSYSAKREEATREDGTHCCENSPQPIMWKRGNSTLFPGKSGGETERHKDTEGERPVQNTWNLSALKRFLQEQISWFHLSSCSSHNHSLFNLAVLGCMNAEIKMCFQSTAKLT